MPPVIRPFADRAGRLALIAAVSVPALGCGPTGILNAIVPKDGYRVERDLAYGEGVRHRLDAYIPARLEQPARVVIFFYGGGWDSGSKGDYLFVGQALASQGFVTVIPDYRLHPEVGFPAFVKDGAAAVAWVRRSIAGLGGDPSQIYLMGHSAGAHIAALLALDHDYLAEHGMEPSAIEGFLGLAGPYDFLPLSDPELKSIFAVDDMQATQPITFADASAPPALLLHGGDDRTVLPENSRRLATALRAEGNTAEVEIYDGLGHIALVLSLAAPFRWLAPTLEDVTAFIRPATS